jgi:hypothetical protein
VIVISPASMPATSTERYARAIEVSARVHWEIERDVIRGRRCDYSKTFLPAGLSLVDELPFLSVTDRRVFGQVQGRTYANLLGLVERFIGAKMLECTRDHCFGDQVALAALVRFTDEELKHQALFRRLEEMMAADMPHGYACSAEPNALAGVVLGAGSWAVLALTCHLELSTLAHYRESIEPESGLSPLWKDVYLFHWREESQHTIVDELEWQREDAKLDRAERDAAVGELIELYRVLDGVVQSQARADAQYFQKIAGSAFSGAQQQQIASTLLKAYRWQFIASGLIEPRFQQLLYRLVTQAQAERLLDALAPLVRDMPTRTASLVMARTA